MRGTPFALLYRDVCEREARAAAGARPDAPPDPAAVPVAATRTRRAWRSRRRLVYFFAGSK